VSNAFGYDLGEYGQMVVDRIRMGAHAEAISRAVTPGAIVLDLGAGTGICSILACRHGARKVYAIESEEVIEVARRVAADNVADRIEFIREVSTRVQLPERVDVMITDLRGALPMFHGSLHAVADARERLLAPSGTLVPQRDILWAGLVEDAEALGYSEPLAVTSSRSCTRRSGADAARRA
jgi:protein arginine N-methyltransferase 1